MSEYSAWFECVNGCPGRYSLLEVIYRCPTCDDLLDVTHDIEPSGAGRPRVDAAVRRPLPPQHVPLRLRRLGEEGGVVPFIDNENIVSTYEAARTSCGRTATARCSVEDLWVKQRELPHGLLQGPGMTVSSSSSR